jgi:glycosyltransferase involved in cell wall biosynthesis
MRIARVVQYFQPRFGYADYYLMTAFKRLGHEVCIITSDYYSPEVSLFDNSVNRKIGSGKSVEYGLIVYRLPTFFEMNGWVINLVGMKKVLEDFKPDVVHSNDLVYPLTLLAVHYRRKFRYKLFVDSITGSFNPTGPKALAFKMYKRLFARYLQKNVSGFFAICQGSKKWLFKSFHVPNSSIKLVPLAADSNVFLPDAQNRQVMRDNLGFKTDEIVLIYTGKITHDKDIDVLIRSLALVACDFSGKLKLLIIGNGQPKYLKYLSELEKMSGVLENVVFIPTVDRRVLPKYFNAADVAIWPGIPSISIIEAMASGLPIIIAKYARPREDAYDTTHLLEYENGLSFQRGDVLQLASSIRRLASNESLRKEMGKKSRKLVEEKLNWDKVAIQLITIYDEIC